MMRRRLIFDLLFLAVIGWGSSILIAIAINRIGENVIQPIVLGMLLLFGGVTIGVFSISRSEAVSGGGTMNKAWLFVAGFAVSMSCALLLTKLFFVLSDGETMPWTLVILSLTFPTLSTMISMMVLALRPASVGVAEKEGANSGFEPAHGRQSVSIEDVIISDPNAVCPLCRTHPHKKKHVLIQCPNCRARFCSEHLEDLDFRCYKCRTVIPYQKEIKLFILQRR